MPAPECGKRRKDCFQLEGILYFSPEERPETNHHIKFIQSLSSRSQGPIYFTTLEHGQFYITEVSELNP